MMDTTARFELGDMIFACSRLFFVVFVEDDVDMVVDSCTSSISMAHWWFRRYTN